MPINQSVRQATLKGVGLALLATLACAAPATAQTMSAADTLAYINERCEGYKETETNITGRLTMTGEQLTWYYFRSPNRRGGVSTYITSFDLRRVDIPDTTGPNFLGLGCGVSRCFSRTTQSTTRDRSRAIVESVEDQRSAVIWCRQPDRVANALRHLQQLMGGRIADPVDPFAN